MKLYKLKLDFKITEELNYDAVIIPTEKSNNYRQYFLNPNLYDKERLPKEIKFKTNYETQLDTDFLFTDSRLFIISKKIIDIISNFANIKFTLIPIVLINDTTLEKKIENEKERINIDYFAIRFENLDSYFDSKHSDYIPTRTNPNLPSRINKLVLKEPFDGFPNLFRTKEKVSEIFITEFLKNKIEGSNVKRCVFEDAYFTPFKEKSSSGQKSIDFRIYLKENFENKKTPSFSQFYKNFASKAFELNDEEYLNYLRSIRCPFWFIGKASKIKEVYNDIQHIENIDKEIKKVISVITSSAFLEKKNIKLMDWLNSRNWQSLTSDNEYSIKEIASFEYGNNYIKSKIMEMTIFKIF